MVSCENDRWEPSCNDIITISPLISVNDSVAELNIVNQSSDYFPNYDIEYDTVNFEIGNGIRVESIALPFKIENINIENSYTVYVRRRCVENEVSQWFGPYISSFQTNSNCEDVYSMFADSSESNYIRLTWNLLGDIIPYYESEIPGFYEIEYGVLGFDLGTGTKKITSNKFVELVNLPSATAFDFYIRTNCGSNNYSEWKGPQSFATE
ncbi:MAG: hypothetical protein R2753_13720 [Chitinophagales bacterium]